MTDTPTRRQKIEAMLLDEPKDLFLRYALAIEMAKEGEIEPAVEKLAELQRETPPYIPAFFKAGQILADADEISRSRAVLRAGVEEARVQGDHHAAGEMSELLADLGAHGA
jgi:predicted Zn-dependent protease